MRTRILFIISFVLCAQAGVLFMSSASVVNAKNVGVPAECEDVMLQAFYWDSYKTGSKYGRTKWVDLIKDTAAINANFDLVWFPPSAYGDGGNGKGGVGYTVKQYSNQDSDWGTKQNLAQLINALHAGNTKVLADVVINHRGNKDSWCSFHTDNFGTYGSWTLTSAHICQDDEVNSSSSAGSCKGAATGAYDTGTGFDARDLDHTSEYVQNWAKAYTQWLLNVINYDGFRYDMTLGYGGQYLKMYNEASQPYFSVSECWEGIDRIVSHLEATDYSTLEFDFPLKYDLRTAIVGGQYVKLRKNNRNTMRGRGLERYAVTFIDNHDTFERQEEDACSQEFPSCNADLSSAVTKNRILQANAYILLMPGVPCVFYPHWKSYTNEINELIAIRKLAGIHSESPVTDETANMNKYSGTIEGRRGNVVLRLGRSRDKSVPEGYTLALEGGDVADYTIFISNELQGVENIHSGSAAKGEKFLKDGKLLIKVGEKTYDVMGKEIKE